jgi:hypothetical protein
MNNLVSVLLTVVRKLKMSKYLRKHNLLPYHVNGASLYVHHVMHEASSMTTHKHADLIQNQPLCWL